MRRLLLLTIALVVLVAVVIVIIGGFFTSRYKGNGKLTVITLPQGLKVTVDDEYLGNTPLEQFTLKAGDHRVDIDGVFQENVTVSEDQESILNYTLSQSSLLTSGYTVSYEELGGLFQKQPQVVLTANPTKVAVSYNDTEVGETPQVINPSDKEELRLRFTSEGYEPVTVEITAKKGYVMRIKVSLLANPLANLKRIDIPDGVSKALAADDITIVSRTEWGATPVNTQEIQGKVGSWSGISLWSVSTESGDATKLVMAIDQLVREKYSLPGIPFAFVVDANGAVYEGLGIFDYDFSQSSFADISFESDSIPILVVTNNGEVSSAQKLVLSYLAKYVEQDPRSSASAVSKIDDLALQGGDERELEFQWQNTSPLLWRMGGNHGVKLVLKDKAASELYVPDRWISPNEVSLQQVEIVYPGQLAKFAVQVKAPYYSSSISEQFVLVDTTTNAVISDAPVSVTATVDGEGFSALVVNETPTGFLNVRSGPGLNYQLLTTIFPGEKLAWVAEQDGWYQVVLRDGTRGWITGDYVTTLE